MRRLTRTVAGCILTAIACVALSMISTAAVEPGQHAEPNQNLLSNPGFELGTPGALPDGWYAGLWPAVLEPNYSVELTSDDVLEGHGAALLRSIREVTEPGAAPGNIGQRIEVAALQGHRLQLRIATRAEVTYGIGLGVLTLEAEYTGGAPDSVSVLHERNIFLPEWKYYEFKVDVTDDMLALHVGLRLIGNGAVWLDDAALLDLGPLVVLAEPARPLSAAGLDNLVAFTRLLGYVRHFHASDEAADCDWDEFAVRNVAIAEAAASPADLAVKLTAMFRPLAPTLQVFPTVDQAPVPPQAWWPEPLGADWQVVYYRHDGCSQVSTDPSPYHTERVYFPASEATYAATAFDPRQPFQAELGAGVTCLLPLAVFADAEGTLPRAQPAPADPTSGLLQYSGNDRASRLAGIALAWNVMQHFYPYFDVVEVDWPAELRTALRSAAEDPDEVAFLYSLRRMMAALQDGHARVYHSCSQDKFQIPVVLGWADDQLVITAVGVEGAGGLQPGDIVLSINGVDVTEAVRIAELTAAAATPQRHRFIVAKSLVQGAMGAEIMLTAKPLDGEARSATLHCDVPVGDLTDYYPPPICELEPGIYYLHVDKTKEYEVEPYYPELAQATGIVVDFRTSSGGGRDFLRHLTDTPMQSARFRIPVFREPDQRNITEIIEGERWLLEPASPRITAKVAFIIDASTQSYLECVAEFAEAYHLGELVGEATSGSNGNINPFIVPGGYEVQWTGMIVLKNDGSQHHAVGILPTVPVARTIRGVAEGRDELLERALAIVRE